MIEASVKFGTFKAKVKADGESEKTVATGVTFGAAVAIAVTAGIAAIAAFTNAPSRTQPALK